MPFVQMRTPGFGDSDWTRVISELRLAGYTGAIDIEGWHDPVYRDELEMTGQVRGAELSQAVPGRSDLRARTRPERPAIAAGTRTCRQCRRMLEPQPCEDKGRKSMTHAHEASLARRAVRGRQRARAHGVGTLPAQSAARQMVQGRPHPLLRRRRGRRRIRLHRLQRRHAGRKPITGAQGRLRLLRLEGREDGPAAARGRCGEARRHRHDGSSGRRRDHAARRGGASRPASR